ncbi:hypothetical protein [Stygiolobus azoricus]|uniref:Uncharacterized protein n=1 Tax=Stygiolobus azoricus TaxID=41675 RepID=A0A650CPL5_9CREN|nr:hypothetical protein [Stygiolobus azoricus]QGR19781.1 hypothetical protein D1868_07155 [Stygiolobus azoricus]
MSSVLDIILELLALKDAIKYEVQKPLKQELLSLLYEIKNTKEDINLDELLEKNNAKDVIELVKKIRNSMVK